MLLQSVYQGYIKKLENGYVMFTNRQIGDGSAGTIYRGQANYLQENTYDVAVKVMKIPEGQNVLSGIFQLSTVQASSEQELHILKSIEHPSIIRYLDSFVSANNFHIIMELFAGQSLQDLIQIHDADRDPKTLKTIPQTIEYSFKIFAKLVEGFYYLSRVHTENFKGISHRDIKPDNIMIDGENVKIIDFGLSRSIESHDDITLFKGSPIYMSPENMNNRPYTPEKNDIWSLGLIFYQLIHGDFPWRREVETFEELIIAQKTIILKFHPDLEKNAQELITKMISYDESKRPTWKELVQSEVLRPYLNQLYRDDNILDQLLENHQIFKSLNKQVGNEQFEAIINKLSIHIFTLCKKSIGKNTRQYELYLKLLKEQVLSNQDMLIVKNRLQIDLKHLIFDFKFENDMQIELNKNFVKILQFWLDFENLLKQ